MENLIQISLMIAKKKMHALGFNEEQIQQLLASGERDLKKEFERLKSLLDENADAASLNQSLHALKGLLLNLGNENLANKLIELKESDDIEEKRSHLRRLLA
jgi:hypothetical protein